MSNNFKTSRCALLAGATLFAMFATPAFAQIEPTSPPAAPDQAPAQTPGDVAAEQDSTQPGDDIVVTGSILRTTTSATTSPLTVVTAESLDRRGINTVQDAIQQLSSNNGPALTNSFTANGAFAGGASSVSLRGLSTNSTLVLFDGQRAAYYPLADDGTRNFVDLNTIPDEVVDRIEVLRDGASSTYGADAIAGVVNIITKKQFVGVGGRAEAGVSEDGIAANQRLSLTAGIGDLDENGLNAYLSGFYYHSDAVYNRDLPYPYNTDDQTRICLPGGSVADGTCGPNNIVNSRDPVTGQLEGFLIGYDTYVRPYDANNVSIPGSRYQLLNPAAGCQYGPGYLLTPEELANPANAVAPANTPVCTVDITNQFGVVAPEIERFGGTARATARFGENGEAYFMANFQQSTVSYTGFPPTIRGQANAGILFRPFSTSSGPSAALAPGSFALSLPVYVCPTGVGDASAVNTGCDADTPGAVLNPNNPFAAQGQIARIIGRPIQDPTFNQTRSRVYRAALGVTGTVWEDVDYRVDATAMHNDLRQTQNGYVYIANLLTSIAQGTFNFVNPGANSQATLDFVSPDNITNASSDLYAIKASLSKPLVELPGGPLQLGVGGEIRYEAVDAPSANPDYNGPTQRYFTLNAFGTKGNRTVYSAFAELNAPIIDQLEINASGRYDNYSSGQDNFSPKIGLKFTPIRQVTVRGTYSRGFRIPSFGEANALPTTGYVTVAPSTLPNSFLNQYGCDTSDPTFPQSCPSYITVYSLGQTTLASPDLKPEKSRSFTGGIVVSPVRNISLSLDYYNIKKTGAITGPDLQPALDAYYAGQPIPAGFNVIPDAPDPNNPNALPRVAFVEAQLINANTIKTEGVDFAANGNFDFGDFKLSAAADLTYIINLSTTFPDGSTQSYEGTLGNFALTAGSGTPEWHGNFQATAEYRAFSLTGNLTWFGGYNLSAEDQGVGRCTDPSGGPDGDQGGLNPGYVPCNVDDYFTLDLTGQYKVNDNFTFYITMLNALNDLPPIDPVTYGAYLYNPVQGQNGIYGRAYRAGVKVGF